MKGYGNKWEGSIVFLDYLDHNLSHFSPVWWADGAGATAEGQMFRLLDSGTTHAVRIEGPMIPGNVLDTNIPYANTCGNVFSHTGFTVALGIVPTISLKWYFMPTQGNRDLDCNMPKVTKK